MQSDGGATTSSSTGGQPKQQCHVAVSPHHIGGGGIEYQAVPTSSTPLMQRHYATARSSIGSDHPNSSGGSGGVISFNEIQLPILTTKPSVTSRTSSSLNTTRKKGPQTTTTTTPGGGGGGRTPRMAVTSNSTGSATVHHVNEPSTSSRSVRKCCLPW